MSPRPSSVAPASLGTLRAGCALVVCASMWSCTATRAAPPLATSAEVRRAGDSDPETAPLVQGTLPAAAYPVPAPNVVAPSPEQVVGTQATARPPAQATQPAQEAQPGGATPPLSATDSPSGPDTGKETKAASPISGYLSSRYRLRWTPDDSDQDLYEIAAVDYADPSTPWFSAHVMGRLAADLDGVGSQPSVFYSIEDTYDESVVATLYHAYVDLTPVGGKAQFRVGRQLDYLTPELAYFDGAAMHSLPLDQSGTEVGVYGGIPVHLYESSTAGDSLLGSYAETRPWKGGRARVDWMHFEGDEDYGSETDDLFGVGLWHTSPDGWSTDAQYTRLESDDRDVRVRAEYAAPDARTFVRAAYYQLLEPQFQQVLDLDPFSDQLQEYFPFTQTSLSGTRALTDDVTLDAGVDVRRVQDDDDEGEYNRDWERYYLTAHVHDLLIAGLIVSLTLDDWTGDDRDIQTWGADLSRDFGKAWKGSAGSYYSLYKYDLDSQNERDDVRTYYLRTSWKRSEALTFDATYDFENDDYDQYQALRLGVIWRF